MHSIERISPAQFETYLLLVETADPVAHIAQRLGIGYDCLKQRITVLFNMLGVSTRLELMIQYHYRERHPEKVSVCH